MIAKMMGWVTLAMILVSSGGCASMTARQGQWKSTYEPPYQGVQHTFYSIKHRDPFAGMLEIDLPATFLVDTCLLPWDLVTISVNAVDPQETEPERNRK